MTARELEERQNYSTTFTLDDASTLLRRRYWLKLTMKHPERIDNEEKGNCMSDCLYKFFKEHPNAKDPVIQGMCPDEFSYLDPPENCNCLHGSSEFPELMSCSDCWHREIQEEMKEEKRNVMSECSMKIQCNNCIHEEVCCLKGTLLDTKNKLEHVEIPAFLHPIKLECTQYSPKNRTFTK